LIPGYAGKLLYVWLDTGRIEERPLDAATAHDCVGGVGLGAKLLWELTEPGTAWDDPRNPVFVLTGPLAGTRVSGGGTICLVTVGAMTGLATSTQANGQFGAFLRMNGYDGICLFGQASEWTYLAIGPEGVELRPAESLLGLDTWETEAAVAAELGGRQASVYGIGPAGEHLVRFAAVVGDKGHVAAHNGVGAVLGAKRLKAMAVVRGKQSVPIANPEELAGAARRLFADARAFNGGLREKWGTAGSIENLYDSGMLPVRNLGTSRWGHVPGITGQTLRTRHVTKLKACWACSMHCRYVEISDGPHAGYRGEEPDYEVVATMTSLIDNPDLDEAVVLANLIDRLGMDANETGWLIAWLMEACERGLLTPDQMDGLPLHWGDMQAVQTWLHRIARREGFGSLLAEGVRRLAKAVGGEAEAAAVFTEKGATPRTHDHRARWDELLDTCLSNTGTVESSGGFVNPAQLGVQSPSNRFDPQEVGRFNAQVNGRRQFEDSLGICRFTAEEFALTIECLNAATGFGFTIPEAVAAGRRAVTRLRAFNLRHGLDPQSERPSLRYGSVPVDGPAAGVNFAANFPLMRATYWRYMGWDERDGRPLPETLRALGLPELVEPLWEAK